MDSVSASLRRLRRSRLRRLGLLLAVLVSAAVPAWASDLWLPEDRGAALLASLGRDCPACLERGLAPCGTADVRPGRRFADHFFQGAPRRSYLITFVMSHAAFRETLLDTDRERVTAALGVRFGDARLIVIDDGSSAARVLPPPATVQVVYAAEQHLCLGVERRTWSCCLGDGGSDRTCLPKADAPHVVLTWRDAVAGDDIVATYTPVPGFSRLVRANRHGSSLYYCLSDEAGRIRTG